MMEFAYFATPNPKLLNIIFIKRLSVFQRGLEVNFSSISAKEVHPS
jgi:hypothetical protein